MHSGSRCTVLATRNGAGQTLYAMAGPCDQSGGLLLNFISSQLDGSYSAGTRSNYTTAMSEVAGSPLAGGESWYEVDVPEAKKFGCLCWSVFAQAGGSPSESDPLVASGSLGC